MGDGPARPRQFGDLQRQAVRGQRRRAHREGQGVLLRERRPAAERKTPSGFSVDGSSGQNFGHRAEVERVPQHPADALQLRPGRPTEEFIEDARTTTSSSAAWTSTSADGHQLTLRHNYIDGVTDDYRHRRTASTRFSFPDTLYQFNSKTNSTVAQLNSTFGPRLQRAARDVPADPRQSATATGPLPAWSPVRLPDGANLVVAGTRAVLGGQRARPGHLRADRRLHVHPRASTPSPSAPTTSSSSSRTCSSATTSAPTSSQPGPARGRPGPAVRLQLLARPPTPGRRRGSRSTSSASTRATSGGCAPRFTLTLGVRVDMPLFPDKPTANPRLGGELRLPHRRGAEPHACSRPASGFNWDIAGDGKQQVRGGVGIFSGRTPYVWLSNQYGNTGIEFTAHRGRLQRGQPDPVRGRPQQPAARRSPAPPPARSPTRSTSSTPTTSTPRVAARQPRLRPRPRLLGHGGHGRGPGLARPCKDIDYENLNRVPGTGARCSTAGPSSCAGWPRLSDVILLTNTDEGNQWSVSGKLERPFRNGLYATARTSTGARSP